MDKISCHFNSFLLTDTTPRLISVVSVFFLICLKNVLNSLQVSMSDPAVLNFFGTYAGHFIEFRVRAYYILVYVCLIVINIVAVNVSLSESVVVTVSCPYWHFSIIIIFYLCHIFRPY